MRITFAMMTSFAMAAALLWTVAVSQEASAANMSPAQLGQAQSSRIVEPAHCKPYWHCYKRCRRCTRICHRCPK
jgi:hypothetical protein